MQQTHKWIKGSLAGLASYSLWLIGIGVILNQSIELRQYLAYALFSILVASIVIALEHFSLIRASSLFLTGLSVGFFEMFRVFIRQMSGWGDLIGVISLLIWVVLGLAAGMIVESIYWLYRRKKEKKRAPRFEDLGGDDEIKTKNVSQG